MRKKTLNPQLRSIVNIEFFLLIFFFFPNFITKFFWPVRNRGILLFFKNWSCTCLYIPFSLLLKIVSHMCNWGCLIWIFFVFMCNSSYICARWYKIFRNIGAWEALSLSNFIRRRMITLLNNILFGTAHLEETICGYDANKKIIYFHGGEIEKREWLISLLV